ncbi:alpha-ketoglutarate-dependent dioxygenase AlkB [Nostoc sphaeroides]|uniref:Alpha-ketoglutarate-dependent dioxygenase AlkB n=1 Tax=Nostoc sphaeroides CCNUC1 TaxID=2653204 RepID=A0A5P8WE46_9NOSO|nr:alpha-ketoglutarate-dependent dioxygenase AlkB [Nostoc sphaeroides]QFS50890.1 alpha-ketoglutarate-dependent dioxygenase AlkB [Nostoc sphaeroides CCNUC1]
MQQLNLFTESTPVLPITYYPDFLTQELANELYQHCLKLEWQQNQIRMLGKTMPVPRLECLYGDKNCDYLYSNSVFLKPLCWTEGLQGMRDRITALTGYKFRIVIGNQYQFNSKFKIQNAKYKIHLLKSWQCRFEPTTYRESRSFKKQMSLYSKLINSKISFFFIILNFEFCILNCLDFWLEHGSLLVMHPGCQSTHLHQLPKTNKVVSTRINLTFRPHTGGGR